VFEFEYPDAETIARHFEFFYSQAPQSRDFPEGRSSAAISEIMKRNMHDPVAAEKMLMQQPGSDEERDWHAGGAASFLPQDALSSFLSSRPGDPF
jgi:hypothetical protein